MGLFSKKETENSTYVSSKDRIVFEALEDNDMVAKSLVLKMKNGNPLVLNFGKLDLTAANKLLGFFTGATVALEGKLVKINQTTYLFARREEFDDGTLNDFIQEHAK